MSVADECTGNILSGLVVFIGIGSEDTIEDSKYLVNKILNLRIFPDSQDQFITSILENNLELLVVSQFTLYSDTRRGRRPGFSKAAPRIDAKDMFDQTVALFKESPLKVVTGIPCAVYRISGSVPTFPIKVILLSIVDLSPK